MASDLYLYCCSGLTAQILRVNIVFYSDTLVVTRRWYSVICKLKLLKSLNSSALGMRSLSGKFSSVGYMSIVRYVNTPIKSRLLSQSSKQ